MAYVVKQGRLCSVRTGSGSTDPSFRLDGNISISATVDGFLATLACDPWRASEPISLICNGLQYLSAPDHGQGIEWAHNWTEFPSDATSWNRASPTAQGRQKDGSSVALCTSNCLERWASADGRYMRTLIKAAFWADVGQTIVTGHPARNVRPLTEMLCKTEHQWGFGGNDHIILRTHTIYLPTGDAVFNASSDFVPVPLTIYVPDTTIPVMQYCDIATLGLSSYPGYPSASTTKTIIMSASDDSAAIAPMFKTSQLGTGIGCQGYEIPVGNNSAFILCREAPAGGNLAGIAGQTRVLETAICLSRTTGSVGRVQTAVAQLRDAGWT